MSATRRIVAWTNLTLDGYTSGPQGASGDTWLYEHAGQSATAEYFEGIWRGADTIVLGRTNYEGFCSVWPDMTRDERTDPRTRDLGRWLDATEKVVISRTVTDALWENSRIARDLAGEIERLRQSPGRDVLVINSASVIAELCAWTS
jgi:dihydrofolate reductase